MNIFDNVRAVLFDLDGTLVETNINFTAMKQAILDLADDYGVPLTLIRDLDILGIINASYRYLVQAGRLSDAGEMRRRAYEILEEIEVSSCRNAEQVEGALDLLNALRSHGIRIGIVTRNCSAAANMSIARTGIYYDVLLTRDDVSKTKPAPEHLMDAIRLLGVSPEEAIIVGDHWMDVLAGKRAGIKTVGFLRLGRSSDFFDAYCPNMVIHSLGELLPALDAVKC